MNNKLPHHLQYQLFHPNSEIHDHATQILHKIHQPICKHAFAPKLYSFGDRLIVSNCPNSIFDKIHTQSLQGFSGFIKAHVLQSYQDNYTLVDCYVCM